MRLDDRTAVLRLRTYYRRNLPAANNTPALLNWLADCLQELDIEDAAAAAAADDDPDHDVDEGAVLDALKP